MKIRTSMVCVGITVVLSGCLVRASRYDQAVREEHRAQERISALEADRSATRGALRTREAKLSQLEASTQNLQMRLDEATALHQQLQSELERLGKNVTAMLRDKGAMQRALDDAKQRLGELRALQAAAQARNEAVASLAGRLDSLVKRRRIEINRVAGEPMLVVPGSLLFEPARSELKRSGETVLQALAHALAASPDWQIAIVAETPAAQGKTSAHAPFALPAQRASLVADRLVTLGLDPSSLSIGGRINSQVTQALLATTGEPNDRILIQVSAVPPSGAPPSAGAPSELATPEAPMP